ncbi:MAG: 4a-hydroxytetrahydrobiopterin dehydratase [Candidatus Woesearchaeota archaeon]
MNDWQMKENKLERNYEFEDFNEALEFVNKVGGLAEEEGHHPDILLYGYNKVKITLTTHDKGFKVTEKDLKLAKKIDEI